MKKIITMTAAGALILAAVPAFGQETKPLGLSARIGIFLPTDNGVKDVSNSWFGAGVDFKLAKFEGTNKDQSNALSVSLDYAGRENIRTVPLILNYVIRQGQAYVFAGAGLTFGRLPDGASTSSQTFFGYDAGVGYDIATGSTPIFVEAKFMGAGNSTLNGFGFFVGARF